MTMCGLAVMAYLWYAMIAVGPLCVVSAVVWHCSFSAVVLICKVGMPVVYVHALYAANPSYYTCAIHNIGVMRCVWYFLVHVAGWGYYSLLCKLCQLMHVCYVCSAMHA